MLKFKDYLNEELVFLDVDVKTNEEVLTYLGKKLEEQGFVKDSFCKALLDREGYAPTGLPITPIGVAIPHAEAEHVIKPAIAVAILRNPVHFSEMANESNKVEVKVVFCLALSNGGNHVEALQQIITFVTDDEWLLKLVNLDSKKELILMLSL